MRIVQVDVERRFDTFQVDLLVAERAVVEFSLLRPRLTRWRLWNDTKPLRPRVTVMTPLFSVAVEYWKRLR